ncbi:MAG: hypothetical protein WC455_11515 [Dehalococcoidia bacterium]
MSNTCETCKHWILYTGVYVSWPNDQVDYLGECRSGKLLRVLDEDDAAEMLVSSWNKVPSEGLGATDALGCAVRILVGKDFGCIHHTTKEQSDGT